MSIGAIPRVDGQHRNRALAAARRTRAVELRCQGWTYEAIADELGYASRATVYSIVHKALATQEAGEVETLKELETERLDRLQASLWAQAMAGDVAAVTEVRRIIEARVRLLGLTSKAGLEQEACVTVVCSCAPGTGHQRPSLAAF
ncbi:MULTISPECIES: helix-turn-helix domain-containing protein [unclassified Knoellia]|uniref:helix-turn-helix domain-containing protein n=1 Tax=Knoellia altitudinis TaxID=3404795 RepID=UPI003610B5DC